MGGLYKLNIIFQFVANCGKNGAGPERTGVGTGTRTPGTFEQFDPIHMQALKAVTNAHIGQLDGEIGCTVEAEENWRSSDALFFRFSPLAERHDFGRVDSFVIDLHFDHFAALVNQVVDAARRSIFWIVETVLAGDVSAPVAQEREGNCDFLSPGLITEGAVHTYTQYLGVRSFQRFQVLLEVLHLFRSTTGESKNIKRQGDVFLSAEVV
jgi:hypothetical protein